MKDGDMGAGKLQYTTYRKAPNTYRTRYNTAPHQRPVNRSKRVGVYQPPIRSGSVGHPKDTKRDTKLPANRGPVNRPETGRFRSKTDPKRVGFAKSILNTETDTKLPRAGRQSGRVGFENGPRDSLEYIII